MRFPGWQIEVNHDNFFWSPEAAQCFWSWTLKISVISAKVAEFKSLILQWSCENEAKRINMSGRENTQRRSRIIHLLSVFFWIMLDLLSSKDYCCWYWKTSTLQSCSVSSQLPFTTPKLSFLTIGTYFTYKSYTLFRWKTEKKTSPTANFTELYYTVLVLKK